MHAGQCPDGWALFDGRCYLHADMMQDWQTANMSCQQQNAFLLDINAVQEKNFVLGFISSLTWIGYNNLTSGGNFAWSRTGSPSHFTDWADGEPTDYPWDHCALIGTITGQWKDWDCGHSLRFICKAGTCKRECLNHPILRLFISTLRA